MSYLYLALAIVAEVIATSSLRATEEFTKPLPTFVMVVGYGMAFYFMTLALRSIPLGVTYAVWSGLGIVLISIIGIIFYNERLDLAATLGMLLIIAGVLVIHLFSKTVRH
ncbi:multidrug efflux SMR transporter [Candidatus Thiothrix sp. Deng01]|uniref:Multidrug efflux SMR transporter n=2 Tax=Thiothrix TaxID=1030 RepID=A0A7L6ASP6_9GAMM|nr:multidrug efflux SMR transporter [Candidatus Thiothrix sp. Deng01]MEB4591429.1 multidrug efflux SMR transporter [Candidatus Thiothrix sp. Deng01]QLQ31947.1 MAG: multidrug efflux SMR transporter [Candidatus Thiothrix singaporensis]